MGHYVFTPFHALPISCGWVATANACKNALTCASSILQLLRLAAGFSGSPHASSRPIPPFLHSQPIASRTSHTYIIQVMMAEPQNISGNYYDRLTIGGGFESGRGQRPRRRSFQRRQTRRCAARFTVNVTRLNPSIQTPSWRIYALTE